MKSQFILLILLVSFAYSMSGSGTAQDPYVITSCSDLESMDYNNHYYILDADLDCTNFQTIQSFYGNFNGQGHDIRLDAPMIDQGGGTLVNFHLYSNINSTNQNYLGSLFNHLTGGLTLRAFSVNANFSNNHANDGIGGLIGVLDSSILNISIANITIAMQNIDSLEIGGILGGLDSNSESYIQYVNMDMHANNIEASNVGGLIGGYPEEIQNLVLNIAHTQVKGSITASAQYIGGFIGDLWLLNNNQITISNSISKIDLSGPGSSRIGGFIGYFSNSIGESNNRFILSKSFSDQSISNSNEYCGGLIGYASLQTPGDNTELIFEKLYSLSSISCDYSGGIFGYLYNNIYSNELDEWAIYHAKGSVDYGFAGRFGGKHFFGPDAFFEKGTGANLPQEAADNSGVYDASCSSLGLNHSTVMQIVDASYLCSGVGNDVFTTENGWAQDPSIQDGYPYLTDNLPDGSSNPPDFCISNSDCEADEFCDVGSYYDPIPLCQPKNQIGESCSYYGDDECLSNICDSNDVCAECEDDSDCPSNAICDVYHKYYSDTTRCEQKGQLNFQCFKSEYNNNDCYSGFCNASGENSVINRCNCDEDSDCTDEEICVGGQCVNPYNGGGGNPAFSQPLEVPKEVMLAVLVVLFSTILIYMLAKGFEFPSVLAFAKYEMGQAIYTLFLITVLLASINFFNLLAEDLIRITPGVSSDVIAMCQAQVKMPAPLNYSNINYSSELSICIPQLFLGSTLSSADAFLRDIATTSFKDAQKASVNIGWTVSWDWVGFVSFFRSPDAGLRMHTDKLNLLYSLTQGLYASLYGQLFFIRFMRLPLSGIFLFLGVVFRALPPTRRLGGLMIAISFGIYLVLPLNYIFMWMTFNNSVHADRASKELDTCPQECKDMVFPAVYNKTSGVPLSLSQFKAQYGSLFTNGELFDGLDKADLDHVGLSSQFGLCNDECANCPAYCRTLPNNHGADCDDIACGSCPKECKVSIVRQDCDATCPHDQTGCPDFCRVKLPMKSNCSQCAGCPESCRFAVSDINYFSLSYYPDVCLNEDEDDLKDECLTCIYGQDQHPDGTGVNADYYTNEDPYDSCVEIYPPADLLDCNKVCKDCPTQFRVYTTDGSVAQLPEGYTQYSSQCDSCPTDCKIDLAQISQLNSNKCMPYIFDLHIDTNPTCEYCEPECRIFEPKFFINETSGLISSAVSSFTDALNYQYAGTVAYNFYCSGGLFYTEQGLDAQNCEICQDKTRIPICYPDVLYTYSSGKLNPPDYLHPLDLPFGILEAVKDEANAPQNVYGPGCMSCPSFYRFSSVSKGNRQVAWQDLPFFSSQTDRMLLDEVCHNQDICPSDCTNNYELNIPDDASCEDYQPASDLYSFKYREYTINEIDHCQGNVSFGLISIPNRPTTQHNCSSTDPSKWWCQSYLCMVNQTTCEQICDCDWTPGTCLFENRDPSYRYRYYTITFGAWQDLEDVPTGIVIYNGTTGEIDKDPTRAGGPLFPEYNHLNSNLTNVNSLKDNINDYKNCSACPLNCRFYLSNLNQDSLGLNFAILDHSNSDSDIPNYFSFNSISINDANPDNKYIASTINDNLNLLCLSPNSPYSNFYECTSAHCNLYSDEFGNQNPNYNITIHTSCDTNFCSNSCKLNLNQVYDSFKNNPNNIKKCYEFDLQIVNHTQDTNNCKACPEICRYQGMDTQDCIDLLSKWGPSQNIYDPYPLDLINCSTSACPNSCRLSNSLIQDAEPPSPSLDYLNEHSSLYNCPMCPLAFRYYTKEDSASFNSQEEACNIQYCSNDCKIELQSDRCANCYKCDNDCQTVPNVRTDCAKLCNGESQKASTSDYDPAKAMKELGEGIKVDPEILSAAVLFLPGAVFPLFAIISTIIFIKGFSKSIGGDFDIPGVFRFI